MVYRCSIEPVNGIITHLYLWGGTTLLLLYQRSFAPARYGWVLEYHQVVVERLWPDLKVFCVSRVSWKSHGMWGFLSHRATPSYHPFLDGIFPNKNHPAIGVPPFMETRMWAWFPDSKTRDLGYKLGVPLVIIHFYMGFSINHLAIRVPGSPPNKKKEMTLTFNMETNHHFSCAFGLQWWVDRDVLCFDEI